MTPDALLPLLLAAALACAALQHAFVALCSRERGDAGWFALACGAAAGAAFAAVSLDPSSPIEHRHVVQALVAAWIAGSAAFAANGAAPFPDRRLWRVAAGLAACAIASDALAGSTLLHAADALRWCACGLLVWLAVRGSRRAWRSDQFPRAAAQLAVGAAACLATVGWPTDATATGAALPALLALATGAALMAWQLAMSAASERAASRLQRDELAHASRLAIVGELTASVAHEINQPLGAILSNADAAELLLEREAPPLDDVRHILADIRRDGLRASGVILHVRKLVRKRELELETFGANDAARGALDLLEVEARRRRQAFELVPADPPVFVHADRALLGQVLINLLANAMDAVTAAEASGIAGEGMWREPIHLEVGMAGPRDVEFRVVDTGIGIPAERLDRLFDSFYTSKDHGMGLGLSIARSIVEAHGGRILAGNNPEGGATFRFTLPLAEAPASPD